jgi:phosphoglycerol transferase MdoB-like AlkP superfamily enzyme
MPATLRQTLTLLRPALLASACYLVFSLLLRVTLWWLFGRDAEMSVVQAGVALLLGVLNDAVVLLYLLLPYSLYLLLLPSRWHQSLAGRGLRLLGFAMFCFSIIYLMVTEYFFFEEFNARFNLVAVDYLIYPTEVFGDIRDAYPVGKVMVMAAIAALAITWLLARRLQAPLQSAGMALRQRSVVMLIYIGMVVVAALTLSTRSLALSNNRVANEISVNGISSFFEAFRTSEIDYHHYYVSLDSKAAFAVAVAALKTPDSEFVALNENRLTRAMPARTNGLGKLNVVVLVEESFGAEFIGAYGAAQSDTPYFDALAKQGLLFSNTYASGTRTARGLEAITASFPPIPSESILHRPGNENITTWGSVMAKQGYHTSFLYGGYGYFDNMNYFYGNNGFEVVDRQQIDNPKFANIWGVSDEDLFNKVLSHLDEQHQQQAQTPTFTMVMSTSNHKPFTFPAGIANIPAEGGGRHAGVRYADYAIGKFIDAARSHGWFDDTLFVIVADHGARVYGKTEIPLQTYRIPLLVYSPKHIQPQVVDTLTGQIDIAPTVLGLLGFAYQAPFFGQDVLHNPQAQRVALFSHNHDVAALRDNKLVVLGLNKKVTTLHYDEATNSYTAIPAEPELTQLAIAYFQTGYELFEGRRL